jgi:malate dehydrogenase (oxaloacetate-decarboxylating)(NADP+)
VTKDRPSGGVNGKKVLYAHEGEHMGPGLADIVRKVRPDAIVGVAAIANAFDEEVCRAMAEISERPLIFALSNPTSKAECSAEEAYKWTDGRCVFASGSPFDPVDVPGRGKVVTSQCNNSLVFPSLSMGVIASQSRRVTERMFLIAARTLAAQTTDEEAAEGRCLPSFGRIRELSRHIAVAVAHEAYDAGLATVMPQPKDMMAFVRANEWSFEYPLYHFNEDGHLHGSRPETPEAASA